MSVVEAKVNDKNQCAEDGTNYSGKHTFFAPEFRTGYEENKEKGN